MALSVTQCLAKCTAVLMLLAGIVKGSRRVAHSLNFCLFCFLLILLDSSMDGSMPKFL